MRLFRFRVGVAAVTLVGSVGALLGVSPAEAAQVVTLTASKTTAAPNESVTLTATATPQPTGVTWYGIEIREQNTGTVVCSSAYMSTCTGSVSHLVGAYTYVAVASSWKSPGPAVTEGVSNPVTVYWGLGGTLPPPGAASSSCDSGLRVTETTSGGARLKVYMLRDSTKTDLCYRVDAAGVGRGGRIRINHDNPSVTPPTNLPSLDGNVAACPTTPGNQLPVPNPLLSGGSAGIDYLVTGYANTSSGVMLCATVETFTARVNLPFNLSGPGVDPGIGIEHTAD